MKILLVEDDPLSSEFVRTELKSQRYTVDVALDGQTGLAMAIEWCHDLVVLDVMLPRLDGISLCRQLRSQGYDRPILLLTARGSNADIIQGLDAGADDYVVKPYEPAQLLARIRALLRRSGTTTSIAELRWGDLCLNLTTAQVTYQQQLIALTPKEYGLLELFLRHPERVFSRTAIIDQLWSIDDSPSEGAVTNLIKDLRRKIKSAGLPHELIETVYGLGYRLKSVAESAGSPAAAEREPAAADSTIAAKLTPTADSPLIEDLAELHKLQRRFQSTVAARLFDLEATIESLKQPDSDPSLHQQAVAKAHRLAGGLGTFGYHQGSQRARLIEQMLQNGRLEAKAFERIADLLEMLKQETAEPPDPFFTDRAESSLVTKVLVISPDAAFAAELKQTGFAWGIQAEVAESWAAVWQLLQKSPPQAAVLHLSMGEYGEDILQDLQRLREVLPLLPVLVVADKDCLESRIAAAQAGSSQFLPKPIATHQIWDAIVSLLPLPLRDAKILVVDDDPLSLTILNHFLKAQGLQVATLDDSSHFWDCLTKAQPDLLILDLMMPRISGIELCQVVRQDPTWHNLPILMVTACTDFTLIEQMFAAGVDDFLSKPVDEIELINRITHRITRYRSQNKTRSGQKITAA